ncbi:MAG: flavin reductase family protein [Thiomicrorhabdus sp.]|jgi:flavin reductase (DIM6/NTAB) family NADH-FMN oxidoreductase RutF|nr:flavin reductase family protein [Thiomicrorhabdus sp.]
MYLKTADISTAELYPLLVEGIIPRPIAWISTLSSAGIDNLAPYSFFTVASCNPPVLAITHINQSNQQAKDTLLNLQQTKSCVVNVVSANQAEEMNGSCAAYPAEISEFSALGIESIESEFVAALSVKQSKVRYECRLRDTITISDLPAGGVLILLDVIGIYIDETIYKEGHINGVLLNSIGKLGGSDYSKTADKFSLQRPQL